MNANRLLALYEKVAEAPDAVPRLRRFVLDLAVRGKLVAQEAGDEPASDILKRIAAEKARLVKAGEIKKPKSTAPIDPAELPISVPSHWAWVRLCDMGRLSGGMTPSKNQPDYWEGDVVWLSPKDIKADEVSNSELKITTKGLNETRLELFPEGSLFIVARSGILKRTFPVAISRVPAASNQDLKVLVPYLKGQERYLQIMFRGMTDFLLTELVKQGTTVQSLKYAEFEVQPFPLPPLAEQRRIVAKVPGHRRHAVGSVQWWQGWHALVLPRPGRRIWAVVARPPRGSAGPGDNRFRRMTRSAAPLPKRFQCLASGTLRTVTPAAHDSSRLQHDRPGGRKAEVRCVAARISPRQASGHSLQATL